jgi:hypothetical protein
MSTLAGGQMGEALYAQDSYFTKLGLDAAEWKRPASKREVSQPNPPVDTS